MLVSRMQTWVQLYCRLTIRTTTWWFGLITIIMALIDLFTKKTRSLDTRTAALIGFKISLHVLLSNVLILKITLSYEFSNRAIWDLRTLLHACCVARIKLLLLYNRVELKDYLNLIVVYCTQKLCSMNNGDFLGNGVTTTCAYTHV